MSNRVRSHIFVDQRFAIRSQAGLRSPNVAECDYEKRVIRIPVDGDTRDELDDILHESIHAGCPYLHEWIVAALARSLAGLLWRLNWRKDA